MFLNIHHRHLRPKSEPVVFYCQHCGHGARQVGARVRKDSWFAHSRTNGCPACGATTPPKKW